MFNNRYKFSVMKAGDKHRLLVTRNAHTCCDEPAEALLTGTPTEVEDLRRTLSQFAGFRYGLLNTWAEERPGQRCELRRLVGQVISTAGTDAAAVAGPYESRLAGVLDAANQVGPAARKAVHQLLLEMLSGCDDVPVRVKVDAWELDDSGIAYANVFLNLHASDDDVVALALDTDEWDYEVAVEVMRDYLVEEYDWLDEWLEHVSPSFEVNVDDLTAWVNVNRPHLAARLADLPQA